MSRTFHAVDPEQSVEEFGGFWFPVSPFTCERVGFGFANQEDAIVSGLIHQEEEGNKLIEYLEDGLKVAGWNVLSNAPESIKVGDIVEFQWRDGQRRAFYLVTEVWESHDLVHVRTHDGQTLVVFDDAPNLRVWRYGKYSRSSCTMTHQT